MVPVRPPVPPEVSSPVPEPDVPVVVPVVVPLPYVPSSKTPPEDDEEPPDADEELSWSWCELLHPPPPELLLCPYPPCPAWPTCPPCPPWPLRVVKPVSASAEAASTAANLSVVPLLCIPSPYPAGRGATPPFPDAPSRARTLHPVPAGPANSGPAHGRWRRPVVAVTGGVPFPRPARGHPARSEHPHRAPSVARPVRLR
ncbi:hypothetical protein Sm713_12620 [Streptomyces sp. TS71-3]|nr:hypothetical protein Sm713_12620 [Streptomyces sp. TS71-3]